MELQVVGTGSTGNCCVLRAGGACGQALLLDAGLPIAQITNSVKGWDSVVGCLITHEHQDHAKSAIEIARRGIRTYATKGTIEGIQGKQKLGDEYVQFRSVRYRESVFISDFTITAFQVDHDVAEPCGWLIRHDPTGELALYATDTFYFRNTFPGVHYWIVECNYTDSILQRQLEEGDLDGKLRTRLLTSHMSLRRLCDILEANDLTELRAVVLIHLSDARSDEKVMVEAVKEVTGIDDVWAAEAGETYQLRLTPF
jgi:phosphoribosyl 1,2-cyclic phosphodiesterase